MLYVKGNPKSVDDSSTLQITETFLERYKEKNPGDEFETLDLYGGDVPLLDGDVFSGWGKLAREQTLQYEEQKKVDKLNTLVDQFLAADKLILAAPMWNFGYPPMVKAYFDCLAVAGRTFKYTPEGPIGLAGDKKLVVVEARGGVYSQGPTQAMEHSISHLKTFFALLGVTDVQHITVEGLNYDPEKTPSIVAEGKEKAQQLASTF